MIKLPKDPFLKGMVQVLQLFPRPPKKPKDIQMKKEKRITIHISDKNGMPLNLLEYDIKILCEVTAGVSFDPKVGGIILYVVDKDDSRGEE
jgi:hypothetical protein